MVKVMINWIIQNGLRIFRKHAIQNMIKMHKNEEYPRLKEAFKSYDNVKKPNKKVKSIKT